MPGQIVSSVLMCHAPIVIPHIGQNRSGQCEGTTRAMHMAAQVIVDSKPQGVVVLSPHTPRLEKEFGVMGGTTLEGSFDQVGFPEIKMSFLNATEMILKIQNEILPLAPMPLDHGAMVPLYFLEKAGWQSKTLVISFPYNPTHQECRQVGQILKQAVGTSGERWSILASGDMSHRLAPGAPSGFHPQAREFDRYLVETVSAGDYQHAVKVDPDLRNLAAEDVVDSLEIAANAFEFKNEGHQFFSYEGPFGVGYLISCLYRKN